MRRLGQHFLDPTWAARVADAIVPAAADVFVEIGAGEGVLTNELAARGARVVAVEIDPALCERLRARFVPRQDQGDPELRRRFDTAIAVHCGNILDADLDTLLPDLAADPVPQPSTVGPGDRWRVRIAGNLPYYISSPILFRLLEWRARVHDACVMLQQEVAERVAAPPGGKEYGVLSVMVQLYADAGIVLRLPRGAFRPPPKVQSAVVRLRFLPALRHPVTDERAFGRLVRAAFRERRKTIRNNLRSAVARGEAGAVAALEAAGIDGRRRAETLTVEEFARLSNFLVGGGSSSVV